MGRIERSLELGEYMGTKLNQLKVKHPSIGDVRGVGLFWGVELVKNQKTKEPFNTIADKVSGKSIWKATAGRQGCRWDDEKWSLSQSMGQSLRHCTSSNYYKRAVLIKGNSANVNSQLLIYTDGHVCIDWFLTQKKLSLFSCCWINWQACLSGRQALLSSLGICGIWKQE